MLELVHETLDNLQPGQQFAVHTAIAKGSVGIYEVIEKTIYGTMTCKRIDNPQDTMVDFAHPFAWCVVIIKSSGD